MNRSSISESCHSWCNDCVIGGTFAFALSKVRKLKDDNNRYQFDPGFSGITQGLGNPGVVGYLNGYPCYVNPDMPTTGVSKAIVLFGDYSAYVWRQVAGIDVFRIDGSGLIAEHWNVRQPIGGLASEHGERFASSLVADEGFPHEPEWSRARVARMLKEMWGEGRGDLVPEFYARSYIQHNPELPGGYERILRMVGDVRGYVERTGGPFPISVHHMVAEKDLVCVHLSIFMAGLDRSDGARSTNTDIFRLDRDGRMVEHWDVLQIDGISLPGGSLF